MRTWRMKWTTKRINPKAAAVPPAPTIHRVRIRTEAEPSQAERTDCQKRCDLSHEPRGPSLLRTTLVPPPEGARPTVTHLWPLTSPRVFSSASVPSVSLDIWVLFDPPSLSLLIEFKGILGKCARGCVLQIPPQLIRDKGVEPFYWLVVIVWGIVRVHHVFFFVKEDRSTRCHFLSHKGAKESLSFANCFGRYRGPNNCTLKNVCSPNLHLYLLVFS